MQNDSSSFSLLFWRSSPNSISPASSLLVKLLDLYPSFPHNRLDVESDFALSQLVVCVAIGTGHNLGVQHRSFWHKRT